MAIFFIWLLLSFGVGYLGDSRRIGFGWALFWALLLSPLIGFAIVLASERKGTFEEELARIQGKTPPAPMLPKAEAGIPIADQITQLKALLDSGALTQEEYEAAKKKLLSQ